MPPLARMPQVLHPWYSIKHFNNDKQSNFNRKMFLFLGVHKFPVYLPSCANASAIMEMFVSVYSCSGQQHGYYQLGTFYLMSSSIDVGIVCVENNQYTSIDHNLYILQFLAHLFNILWIAMICFFCQLLKLKVVIITS